MKKFYPLLFLSFFILTKTQGQMVLPGFLSTNGPVNTILKEGNVVYIGGQFTHVGQNLPYGVALDELTGSVYTSFVKPNGIVRTAVPDGNGGWYIG